MGKHGFLTPKAIANRIKSKGLQKLRWFCQMCQKQCRDENGFKCHLTSESHQRQLLLFAENPDDYIDGFSKTFLETFLEMLKRCYGTKRVQANTVYQSYISDKEHTHMNSTQWETLGDFVKWMGKEGHCIVDQTEKGWFIAYVDRDPEAIRRQEAANKKEKMDMDDDEQAAKFIQQQIERANKNTGETVASEYTELKRESEEEKVAFSLGGASGGLTTKKHELKPSALSITSSKDKKPLPSTSITSQKRKSALDEIMEFEEKKKEKMNRKDYWLHSDIVVKVVTKKLGDKYYKRKAVIKDVVDLYGAVIKMLDTGVKLKVDQAHLETVIPALGKSVLIVNGAYRGTEAVLVKLNEQKFNCNLEIKSGPLKGRLLEGIEYEDISKLHTS